MNDRTAKVLGFVRRYVADNGYPPTIREIGAGVGISSISVVAYHLAALDAQGFIVRRRGSARGILLVQRSPQ